MYSLDWTTTRVTTKFLFYETLGIYFKTCSHLYLLTSVLSLCFVLTNTLLSGILDDLTISWSPHVSSQNLFLELSYACLKPHHIKGYVVTFIPTDTVLVCLRVFPLVITVLNLSQHKLSVPPCDARHAALSWFCFMLFLTWMHPAFAAQKTPLILLCLSLTPWRDHHPLVFSAQHFILESISVYCSKWFAFVLYLLLDHKLHLSYFEHHMFWTVASTGWVYTKEGWMKVLALKNLKLGSISTEEMMAVIHSIAHIYSLSPMGQIWRHAWRSLAHIKEQNQKSLYSF